LLLRSPQAIKQVAQAVGFASEKSFMRAFRGWTGQSPADFRRQSRG
ncbi:MAG: helix-turn-helix transcriptional regulator, partial [Alicycliphilus sp.]|nr:helix-turn-helix transcriptional regulator [Alicycliphilus sp.]